VVVALEVAVGTRVDRAVEAEEGGGEELIDTEPFG